MLEATEIALLVAQALERAGIEYALGGSVATSLQGEPRSTNDVDFAVRLTGEKIDSLVKELGPDFEVDVEALRDAIRRGRSANVFHLPTVTKVDLFVRGRDSFDESEFSRKVRMALPGGEAFVATSEDNLLRKLKWFRLGGEVSDRQWRDILGVLRISGATLDRQYLGTWAERLGVSDLLERAITQAG